MRFFAYTLGRKAQTTPVNGQRYRQSHVLAEQDLITRWMLPAISLSLLLRKGLRMQPPMAMVLCILDYLSHEQRAWHIYP